MDKNPLPKRKAAATSQQPRHDRDRRAAVHPRGPHGQVARRLGHPQRNGAARAAEAGRRRRPAGGRGGPRVGATRAQRPGAVVPGVSLPQSGAGQALPLRRLRRAALLQRHGGARPAHALLDPTRHPRNGASAAQCAHHDGRGDDEADPLRRPQPQQRQQQQRQRRHTQPRRRLRVRHKHPHLDRVGDRWDAPDGGARPHGHAHGPVLHLLLRRVGRAATLPTRTRDEPCGPPVDQLPVRKEREAETPEGPSPRQRHSACALDRHRILILGGFDGETWMSDAYALHICGLDHPGLSENAKRELFIDMEELWKSSSFSDVTLVTATAEIAAHRCILAARCPYFRSMFVSHMKEANEMRVELQCPWSADAMRAFVRFLYTAHVDSELSPLVKCELLGVADEFAVDALKALAETLLVNEIDAHSAPRLLTNAELYASTKLKAACLDFLISNPDSSVLERASAELVHQPNLMKEIILLQSTRRSNSR
eukprot:GHVU01144030.1.p1 GENE.GHVU01144030.1~~GHVU01144030.1.p1  ORF type:complete len:483 (+),score=60.69 GHVU01144030.1:410-1858(+)